MSKDASGLTEEERHNIIIQTLKDINKDTKVFHLRWCPGDNLNEKILKSTPMFWYMKFGWSREDVETVFYKGRIYIDRVFEMSMDRVFGTTYKGARWLPPELQEEKKEKWKRRGYKRTEPWWKVPQGSALHPSQMGTNDYKNAKWEQNKWNYDADQKK